VLLVGVLGFRGLALSATLAALAHGVALLVLLRPRLRGVGGRRLGVTFVKATGASIVMALVALSTERWSGAIAPGEGALPQALRLGLAIAAGLAALAASAAVLRIGEFQEARDFARARVQKLLAGSKGAVS
jgi:peptidoglycan biosynthesis protein MviN/MurJ (putative lipid II flippase)